MSPYHTSTHFTEYHSYMLNDMSFNVENNTLNFGTLKESTWGVGIGMINSSLGTKCSLDDTYHMPHVINSGIHAIDFLPSHIGRPVALLNLNANSFIPSFYSVSTDESFSILRRLRTNNGNRIIIGHLNINSLRNKFDELTYPVESNLNIIILSEPRIDDSFPINQF